MGESNEAPQIANAAALGGIDPFCVSEPIEMPYGKTFL
jgi:hypothetical protein